MTNTAELKKRIKDKGLKLGYIADYLHISRGGLDLKINNKSQFRTGEVEALCDLLDITSLADKERIFFAKDCDYKSH